MRCRNCGFSDKAKRFTVEFNDVVVTAAGITLQNAQVKCKRCGVISYEQFSEKDLKYIENEKKSSMERRSRKRLGIELY